MNKQDLIFAGADLSTTMDLAGEAAREEDKLTKLQTRRDEKLDRLVGKIGVTGLYDADSAYIDTPYLSTSPNNYGEQVTTARLAGVNAPELKVNGELTREGINARIQADSYMMGVDAPNFPEGEGLDPQYYDLYTQHMNPALEQRAKEGKFVAEPTGKQDYYGRDLYQGYSEGMPQSKAEYLVEKGQAVKKDYSGLPEQESPRYGKPLDFMQAIKQRESSGDYTKVNKYGYLGAYQFGAARLQDMGVVKPGTKNKDLDRPEVWTGKYGFTDKQAFLNNEMGQEKLARDHFAALSKQLAPTATDVRDLYGKVAAAHLLGVKGSRNLDKTDAFGTSGREYYELGSRFAAGDMTEESEVEKIRRAREAVEAKEGSLTPERFLNAGKAIAYRAAEGFANTFDLLAEGTEYLYKKAQGKNVEWSDIEGLYGEKESEALKKAIGYDDSKMQKLAEETKAGLEEAWKTKDYWKVLGLLGKAMTTPELGGESLGFIIGLLAPGGIAKAGLQTAAGVAKNAKALQAANKGLSKADAIKQAEDAAGLGYKITKQLVGQAGQVGYAEQIAREAEAEYKELYDEDMTFGRRVGAFTLALISGNMDAVMGRAILVGKDPIAKVVRNALMNTTPNVKRNFVSKLASATGIASGRILGAMGQEAVTEGIQSTLETMAGQYRDGNVQEVLERNAFDIATESLMGAAGGGQFAAPSTAKDALIGTVRAVGNIRQAGRVETVDGSEIKDKQTKEDLPTSEELDFMANTLAVLDSGDTDFTKPEKMLDDLYRAESVFERQKAVAKNPELVKEAEELFKSAKAKLLAQLDKDDNVIPTFGSREAAEDYIDFAMENTPDVLNSKRLNRLEAIAKANGAEEYFKQAKTYFEVEKEAVEGPRGWRTYGREVKYALETAKTNPDRLKKALDKTQKYLNTQERYVEILSNAIAEAELEAKKGKTNIVGLKPKSIKVQELETLTGKPYTIHFTKDGEVHPATRELLETKKRNVENLIEVINSAGDYMVQNKIKSPVGVEGGIHVPAVTSGKAKDVERLNAARDEDRNYYKKYGVTKVITDFEDPRWNNKEVQATEKTKARYIGDYYKTNRTKINVGKYSKNDVVLVNIRRLENKLVPKAVSTQIKQAVKAGATIILDTGTYNPKAPELMKAYAAVTRQITKFSPKDSKYAAVVNKSGTFRGSLVFMPTEKAAKVNEEIKTKVKIKKEQANTKADIFDKELLAYAEAEAADSEYTMSDEFKAYFKDSEKDGVKVSGVSKAVKYLHDMYTETIDAGVAALTKLIMHRALSEEITTDENRYEEAIAFYGSWLDEHSIEVDKIEKTGYKTISSKVLKAQVMAETAKQLEAYQDAFKNLAEWKKLQEAQRSTEGLTAQEYKKKVEKLGFNNKAFELSLKDTLANKIEEVDGKRKVKKKYEQKLPGASDPIVHTLDLHVLPLEYIQVSKTTALNSIEVDLLLKHPVLGPKITKMQEALKYMVNIDKNAKFLLQDAPGIALVFNEEGEVNVNVAAAMVVAMENFYKANSYMLTRGRKSVADVARMLRQDESAITPMMLTMLQDKGMFGRTMAAQMSKNIAGLLGLSKFDENNDVEKMRYTQAMTDLAHMAILTAIQAGELERDTSLKYKDLLEAAGEIDAATSKNLSGELLVFYKLKDDSKKDELAARYDETVQDLPIEEFYRKEPKFTKPSAAYIESKLETIRNDKLGQEIPGEGKEAMRKMMNTEYNADKLQIEDVLKFEDDIRTARGYKAEGSEEFKRLHALGQEEQIVINREIDKEFEELHKLREQFEDKKALSMWFDFYYSTNGRYFYDSNTLNPGTMKQLVRWLIQPKAHRGRVSYEVVNGEYVFKKKKFKNGKLSGRDINITKQMSFALGQALGLPVDKRRISLTIKTLKPILDVLLDKEQEVDFDALFKEVLQNKKASVGGYDIKLEHIAHMRQAFLMLRDLRKDGMSITSLSAEIDAKTSGFGLKTSMMPLDDNALDSLQKTGQAIGERNPLSYALAPDDGEKALFDAYQSLAKDMITDRKKLENSDIAPTSAFGKKAPTWGGSNTTLLTLLPEVTDTISSALRNLFKQPFMEFNYSAGMKAIRQSLAYTMTRQLVDEVAYAEGGVQEAAFKKYGLSKYFNNLKDFKNLLADPRMQYDRRYKALVADMDVMFGSQVQAIFEANFPKAIQAQGVINQAFKAMFGMYKVAYDKKINELRAAGPVTEEKYISVLVELHKIFPWIKGPLSQEGVNKDGIAIYKIKTSGAPGAIDGGLTSQVALNEEFTKKYGMVHEVTGKGILSTTLGLEMAKFEAAMNAGAVVPIHYIDGALLAKLVNEYEGDLTVIHDAKIPAVEDAFDTSKIYNKWLYEISYGKNRYKLVGEIKNALERVQKEYEEGGYTETAAHDITTHLNMYGTAKDEKSKPETLAPTEYVKFALEQIDNLYIEVEEKISKIQEEIQEHGIVIEHMFSGYEGAYVLEGSADTKTSTKAKTKEFDDIIEEEKGGIITDLEAILKNAGKKELDKIKDLIKDCGNGM